MRINQSHKPWLVVSLIILGACGGWYWYDVTRGPDSLNGPSGGSFTGITFGIIGSLFMLFAGLLGMRKRFRTLRIGRAEFWMRGHLWLGTLALPIIWLHGGFRHGGLLTTILMWLTYLIVISGLVGAILQHFMPRAMTRNVTNETIFEQIPNVLRHLAAEADDVAAICGPENSQDLDSWRKARITTLKTRCSRALITAEQRDQLIAAVESAPAQGSADLKQFYAQHVKPYLTSETTATSLADSVRAGSMFAQQRVHSPAPLHTTINDLARICDEARELRVQQRMHRWLHGWLFVHVPLSMALLVLAVAHVIVSLRYT